MIVTTEDQAKTEFHPSHGTAQATGAREPIPLSWGKSSSKWVLPVVVLAAVAALAFGINALLSRSSGPDDSLVYYTVRRGTLPITVTERGNLESQITEEIICDVENFGGDRSGNTGTQILFIVPNGSSATEGDLLVELDSAPLTDRLDTQFLALQRAEAEKIQANSKYKNQETQNETNKAEAELKVRLAKLDLESYEDEANGTYKIELQNIDMDIQEARATQLISQSDFDAVSFLYNLGYKSKGDLEAAKLARLKADSDLASRLARYRQLQTYTYEMEKMDREGKVATAERNLEQALRNNEAELAQAKAASETADRAYEKEQERYERYKKQLENCKIYAPQAGMVAYATGDGRFNRGSVIEEGAFVRQRQKILTLPNLSKMQVNTAVHESVLDQVQPGLKASIRVDAFPDRSYSGTVKTVAVLPDQGGWMASDTKVYKTIVTIDQDVEQVKPGMTAVVEIDIETLTNVISVPIQAVIQRGSKSWCYVAVGNEVKRRDLTLGKTNDKFIEIRTGIEEHDTVVLNPMSLVDEQASVSAEKNVTDGTDREAEDDDQRMPRNVPPPGAKGKAMATPSQDASAAEGGERRGKRGPAKRIRHNPRGDGAARPGKNGGQVSRASSPSGPVHKRPAGERNKESGAARGTNRGANSHSQ